MTNIPYINIRLEELHKQANKLNDQLTETDKAIHYLENLKKREGEKQKEEKEKSDWFFLCAFNSSRFHQPESIKGEVIISPSLEGVLLDKEFNTHLIGLTNTQNLIIRFLKEGVPIYYSASNGTVRFYLKKTQ